MAHFKFILVRWLLRALATWPYFNSKNAAYVFYHAPHLFNACLLDAEYLCYRKVRKPLGVRPNRQ